MNTHDTTDSPPDQQPFAEEDRLADKIIALAAIDPEIARNELSRELMRCKLRLMATEKALEITRDLREVGNVFILTARRWPWITKLYIRTLLVLVRVQHFLHRKHCYLAV